MQPRNVETYVTLGELQRAEQRLLADGFVPQGEVIIGMVADPRKAIADLFEEAKKSKRKVVLVKCGYGNKVWVKRRKA